MLCCWKNWIHRSGVLHRSKWVPGRPADKSMEAVKLSTTYSYKPWCQQYKCMFNKNISGLFISPDMQNSNFVLLRYSETRSWNAENVFVTLRIWQEGHVVALVAGKFDSVFENISIAFYVALFQAVCIVLKLLNWTWQDPWCTFSPVETEMCLWFGSFET